MRLYVFGANLMEAKQWIEAHGLSPYRVAPIDVGPQLMGLRGTVIMIEGWSRNRNVKEIIDVLAAQHAKGDIVCMSVALDLFGFAG